VTHTKLGTKVYKSGLYLRLSDKDKEGDVSQSIDNQKQMLTEYAQRRNFSIVGYYVDDGFSGTSFERPGFLQLKHDIEIGKINLVITKDLSRLGRNYSEAGYYQDVYFPEHSVRYIAVLDGYDSDNEYTTRSAPWQNVANEFYAKDASMKIRSVFHSKMERGEFFAPFAPYGYKKDCSDKHKLLIDDESAEVVRQIFALILEGYTPKEIANSLNSRSIPTPAQRLCKMNPNASIEKRSQRQEWTSSIVSKLARNPVYIGTLVQNRQKKASYKSKTIVQIPKNEWVITEKHHEAIIPKDIFDAAQKTISRRKSEKNGEFTNMFAGVAFCYDCGRGMSTSPTRQWKEGHYNLSCGRYKLYGSKECSNHFINYDHLSSVVYNEIVSQIETLNNDDWLLLAKIGQARLKQQDCEKKEKQKQLDDIIKQISSIDSTIQKLYEDNLIGKISDERFVKLLKSFEEKQELLKKQQNALEGSMISSTPLLIQSAREFSNLIKGYILPSKLTRQMLLTFVEKIEVHQGTWENTDDKKIKKQQVDIYLKFLGLQRL